MRVHQHKPERHFENTGSVIQPVLKTGDKEANAADKVMKMHEDETAPQMNESSPETSMMADEGEAASRIEKQGQDNLLSDPVKELGKRLLDEYPEGVPVIVYAPGKEFKPESELWAKRNNAVGLKGETFSADQVQFGKAVPSQMEQMNQNQEMESVAVDQIVTRLAGVLQNAVKSAEAEKTQENADYVPNENAYKIKTLAISSHGWCSRSYGSGTSAGLNEENYISYIKTMSPFLTSDVNVILYACNSATGKDENEGGSWVDMKPGGKDSLAAKIRDELADSGHSEARVWGHTATGHFYDTWPMRLFDANSKGQNGDSYFDYVFKDYIASDVNNVITEIELRNYETPSADQKQSIADLTRQKVYSVYYRAYQYSMNNEKYKQANNGTTEDVHLAEAAPLFPDAIAAIVKSTFETKYKAEVPAASKIADSIIPKVVPKIIKK